MNTSLSTAAASGTVSLAAIVLLNWALSFVHVVMPADVATAAATLVTAGVHYLIAVKAIPAPPAATRIEPVVSPTPATPAA
jgi:hypothetical protein